MKPSAILPTPGGEHVTGMVPRVLALKTILVPIDFSEGSEKALDYAVPFAMQFGARITVLHIAQVYCCASEFAYMPVEQEEMHERMRQRLGELAASRIGPEIMGGTVVRDGTPCDEIIRAARDLKADIIVINTHGYTGLKHMLMGSTAELVVRNAPCPVLVVREVEHEFV
jgi:universal stress protein A